MKRPEIRADGEDDDRTCVAMVHPLYNWPNAISVARMMSGPAIACMILHGHWKTAFFSLTISGEPGEDELIEDEEFTIFPGSRSDP
jgi:hypothetical protein